MDETTSDRDELEVLADEFIERRRLGQCPSVSQYAAEHPALAEEIRELFPTIAAMERLKAQPGGRAGAPASLAGVRLERLGDFRIVRELGRGGMGIVFEAEQESLGRRVAIKVLPRQSLLEAKQLRRFTREARIAASLHHTNIVPVFGVGEQDGFHYYVMQYIRGAGLDRIIARLAQAGPPDDGSDAALLPVEADSAQAEVEILVRRLAAAPDAAAAGPPSGRLGGRYWTYAARIGLQVASALQYAHEQGTLHRDVKPANLLLDARGVVWVSDFGLAKAIQSEDVTQTGQITGTLRYMAPEQFRGQTDARSDIYSLGLTLYELLTLRPAYDETDRSRLVRRITEGQVEPPRKLDGRIPRDLETIVLKAIDREPDRRYQSAGDLATDLRCFLEDRPIQARRATSPERLWRWCRRNPALAGLTGATMLLILLVAVIATAGYVRTKAALAGEARQRERAEATAELAIEALDRIFGRFSPGVVASGAELTVEGADSTTVDVPAAPALSKEAAALLEDLLAFYDRLARQVGNDRTLRRKAAEANRRVGDIRQSLGQSAQAAAAYRRAIAIYRELAAASPNPAAHRTEIATIHNELGWLFRAANQPEEARQAHAAALAILTAAAEDQPSAEVRCELARTHYCLALKSPPDPRARPRDLRPEAPGRPDGPPWRPGRPGPRPFRDRPGPDESAEDRDRMGHLAKAIELLSVLVHQGPTNPSYRHLLALCHRQRFAAADPERPAAAELTRATEILEGLVRDFPHAPDYRHDLSETYAMAAAPGPPHPGSAPAAPFTDEQAQELLRKALDISDKLVAEHPNIPRYLASQARILHRLGTMEQGSGRWREAENSHRRAVAVQAALVEHHLGSPYNKIWLAAFRDSLAALLVRLGRHAEAVAALKGTAEMLAGLMDEEPDMWFIRGMLVRNHTILANVLRKKGDEAGAAEADRAAEDHRRGFPPRPRPPRGRGRLRD